MNQVQMAIDAVLKELERQKNLPEFNYQGGWIHPLNAICVLRDFTDIQLDQDQGTEFLRRWDALRGQFV